MTFKKLVKFSKPSAAVIKNKQSFFQENSKLLNYVTNCNEIYIQNDIRNKCKNCDTSISGIDFISHKVLYILTAVRFN